MAIIGSKNEDLVSCGQWNESIPRENIVNCGRLYVPMDGSIQDTAAGLLDGIKESTCSIRVRRTS